MISSTNFATCYKVYSVLSKNFFEKRKTGKKKKEKYDLSEFNNQINIKSRTASRISFPIGNNKKFFEVTESNQFEMGNGEKCYRKHTKQIAQRLESGRRRRSFSCVKIGPKIYKNYLQCNFLLFLLQIFLVFQLTFAQEDRRCFLEKGGSVQNFFVSESLPIGDVIGELEIFGNASEAGDIYLRLEDPNSSPVQIAPSSKKLILTEKLDKEGKIGRSHVVINVFCQKRKIDDVDTKIPINIRVTDANDNSPIFVKAPYFVNVSEATVTGTVIFGDIKAVDEDQQGPFSDIHYSVASGPFSSKFTFETPLSGTLQLQEPLDYETSSSFNLTIVAQDRGSPPRGTETYVTVQVIDSDDQNPSFNRQRYMAFLPSEPVKGSIFEIQPEPIFAEDQDTGIRAPVFYSLGKDVPEASYLGIAPDSGEIFLTQDIPDDIFLQPIALSVLATQVDNPDRVATAILTVSRRGSTSKQLQFLQRTYEKTLNENLPEGTLIASTLINKKTVSPIRFSLEKGGMGVFRVNSEGSIFLDYELDYETQREYAIKVYVTDGEYNDTATLFVKVLNVNDWDPRFQYPQYAFYVEKGKLEPGDTIGNVTVADGDGDEISLHVRGRDARMFTINPTGEIIIKRLVSLNSTEAHIIIVAKDSGKPPRQTSVPVTIYLPQSFISALPLGASSSFLLMVVFGSLVALFILVIICLAVYIHKNKKLRDEPTTAMPTKMNHIMTNNGPHRKLDPLSVLANQQDAASDITGIEAPKCNGSILEANNPFKRSYINDSLRASTISMRSHELDSMRRNTESKRYTRNPLANGSAASGVKNPSFNDGVDSLSLNGSNATTASTATAGSESPPNHGSRSSTPNAVSRFFATKTSSIVPVNGSVSSFCTYDGTARATGGLPTSHTSNGHIPPAPPAPSQLSTTPNGALPKNNFNRPSTSSVDHSERVFGYAKSPSSDLKKISWPSSSIPKKVKKLSWEDELHGQTELNPDVSVAPMPPMNEHSTDIPNLTVYF